MKNLLSFILLLTICNIHINAQSVWNGIADVTWYTSNTNANEYEISTPEQLAGLAFLTNGGNDFNGKTLKLTTDIILNENVLTESGNLNLKDNKNFNQWTPICNNLKFMGTFDGCNHTIFGIYINNSSESGLGFFGQIGSNGIIRNLNISDSYIKGNGLLGSVCARSSGGIIDNCHNLGTIESINPGGNSSTTFGGICGMNDDNGIIRYCINKGKINGYCVVGGICGDNYGSIENCENYNSINGYTMTLSYVGGICGSNSRILKNNKNYGIVTGYDIIGGICGDNYSSIENCHNNAIVKGHDTVGGILGINYSGGITECSNTATVNGNNKVGGIMGRNITYFENAIIYNCYNTGTINGESKIGGISGHNETYMFKNCYNTGNIFGTSYVGGLFGLNEYGTITFCYNAGTINCDDWYTGSICGQNFSGVIEQCYWLENTANTGIGNYYGSSTLKTGQEFSSGEVCWLLNNEQAVGVWGQNITNEPKDIYPILGGPTVYKNENGYNNDNSSGINNITKPNKNIKITSFNNCITINTNEPTTINIHNLNGQLLWHGVINGHFSTNINPNSIYIINGIKIKP